MTSGPLQYMKGEKIEKAIERAFNDHAINDMITNADLQEALKPLVEKREVILDTLKRQQVRLEHFVANGKDLLERKSDWAPLIPVNDHWDQNMTDVTSGDSTGREKDSWDQEITDVEDQNFLKAAYEAQVPGVTICESGLYVRYKYRSEAVEVTESEQGLSSNLSEENMCAPEKCVSDVNANSVDYST